MNVGIAGTGFIANRCLDAFSFLPQVNCCGIWGRSADKATDLAVNYGIDRIYDSYHEMLLDPAVDFVYNGLLNHLHYSYTREALEAGKNVILEKPFTLTGKDCAYLISLAKEKRLFLFEAITTLHMPVYHFIKENLHKAGNVKLVQCNFSQYSSRYDAYLRKEVKPALDPAFGGGALTDQNIYNLHFVTSLFGRPQKVEYHANIGFNGVDTSGIAILTYNDFIASCTAAKDSNSRSFASIQGDKGTLLVDSTVGFCASGIVTTKDGRIEKDDHWDNHMCYEFEDMRTMFEQGDYDGCYEMLEQTRLAVDVLEAAGKNIIH